MFGFQQNKNMYKVEMLSFIDDLNLNYAQARQAHTGCPLPVNTPSNLYLLMNIFHNEWQ